jgi:hypothetical protein
MAKVSAHGREIGTVYLTTTAKRYMSDGVVLVNYGFGWKLGGKIKDGVTPEEAYAAQVAKSEQFLANRQAVTTYRKLLHDLAPLSKRWKLHAAVQSMPDDCDGVWSEACDGFGDNVSADVDEVAELCRAYRIALIEANAMRTAKLDQGVR